MIVLLFRHQQYDRRSFQSWDVKFCWCCANHPHVDICTTVTLFLLLFRDLLEVQYEPDSQPIAAFVLQLRYESHVGIILTPILYAALEIIWQYQNSVFSCVQSMD